MEKRLFAGAAWRLGVLSCNAVLIVELREERRRDGHARVANGVLVYSCILQPGCQNKNKT